jgi:hypothetical protein
VAEAAAEAGMSDPRTATTATSTTTEAGASRIAAEAIEAATRGGRAADPKAVTGLAGRQIGLHWRPICPGTVCLISILLSPCLFKLFMLMIVHFLP